MLDSIIIRLKEKLPSAAKRFKFWILTGVSRTENWDERGENKTLLRGTLKGPSQLHCA